MKSSRYENVSNITTIEGKVRKNLSYNVPINDDDDFFYIHNVDRVLYSMEKLADQYYGNKTLWWIIAKANNVKLPFNFREEIIRIPKNISQLLLQIK